MKAYFIQLVNGYLDDEEIIMSGAVLAESKKEAEIKAIKIAKKYRKVKELDANLFLYTLIELTEGKPAQFNVGPRM